MLRASVARRWLAAPLSLAAIASCAALAPRALSAQPRPDASAPARVLGERPACVAASAQPYFNGTGYNHLVTLENRCDATVTCHVSSDINPREQRVVVRTGESRTVNTYFNAAGYGFTATARCATGAR